MKIMIRPAVTTGMENSSRTLVTSWAQQNIGIRSRPMPGARSRKMVTRKLMEPRMELMPVMIRPSTSRFTPVSGVCVDSGAYIVQPVGEPPNRNELSMSRPPARNTHSERALTRGKAMSAAPTWSGTT